MILFLSLLSCFFLMNSVNSEEQKKDIDMQSYIKSIDYGLFLVGDQPQNRFLPIPGSGLPFKITNQINHSLIRFLNQAALPRKSKQSSMLYFLAENNSESDLVVHRWKFLRSDLRFVESRNAAKLEIDLKEINITGRAGFAKSIVSEIVRLEGTDIMNIEYKIELQWPEYLQNGVKFSSNPNQNINTVLSWHNRIDAFVSNDILMVIFYKKIPQMMGYQNGFGWIKQYSNNKN